MEMFKADYRNLDKSPAELARILKVSRGTVTRALEHPRYRDEFAEMRRNRKVELAHIDSR